MGLRFSMQWHEYGRRSELRMALDLFGSFSIKGKGAKNCLTRHKKVVLFYDLCKIPLLLLIKFNTKFLDI